MRVKFDDAFQHELGTSNDRLGQTSEKRNKPEAVVDKTATEDLTGAGLQPSTIPT